MLTSTPLSSSSLISYDTFLRTLLSADPELKSHKDQVPFLAAVSFEAHLSPLISILMVYSCRSVDDFTVCGNVCSKVLGRLCVRVRARSRHEPILNFSCMRFSSTNIDAVLNYLQSSINLFKPVLTRFLVILYHFPLFTNAERRVQFYKHE